MITFLRRILGPASVPRKSSQDATSGVSGTSKLATSDIRKRRLAKLISRVKEP